MTLFGLPVVPDVYISAVTWHAQLASMAPGSPPGQSTQSQACWPS